jgi:hypothetical protein
LGALAKLGIHPDTYMCMDNLLLGQSISMTIDGLRGRLESGQPAFPEREAGEVGGPPTGHPFLIEIQRRLGGKTDV